MGVKMIGGDAMAAKLRRIASVFPDRVGAALYKRAEIILTEAKRRCPVAPDGGVLRASGRAWPPVRNGRRVTVMLSFGGAADAYALAVHEHLSSHSPHSWIVAETQGRPVQWTSAGTGPKFLEGPITEAQPTLVADLAKDLHMNGGGFE